MSRAPRTDVAGEVYHIIDRTADEKVAVYKLGVTINGRGRPRK